MQDGPYEILFHYHKKWEEYFDEMAPEIRWEAMACLLASELKKEKDLNTVYKSMIEFNNRRAM